MWLMTMAAFLLFSLPAFGLDRVAVVCAGWWDIVLRVAQLRLPLCSRASCERWLRGGGHLGYERCEQFDCRMRAAPGTEVLTGVVPARSFQEVWVMLAETITPLATVYVPL